MKYLLSFLMILVLFGCSSPAAHTVTQLGNTVKQCCTSLSCIDKKPVNFSPADAESSASNMVSVSVFEIEGQLIRTW